jgi:hypothetical protein
MISRLVLATLTLFASGAQADDLHGRIEKRPALLVADFLAALDHVATSDFTVVSQPGVQLWIDGLRERGIDPSFVARRLDKARKHMMQPGSAALARFSTVDVELFDDAGERREAAFPTALHAFRLDVVEDHDDLFNDDVYAYFITTHDDLVWGKVTSIYTGLDQGDSVFLSPEDRGLFGPRGEKLVAKNHLLVDFGLIESDGDDVKQLQKLSDVIVDLAIVALTVAEPTAGAAAAQARAEVKNLLHLVIAMDKDDRLVTDTLRFTPDTVETMLGADSVVEMDRFYERKKFMSRFAWRVHFRLLK